MSAREAIQAARCRVRDVSVDRVHETPDSIVVLPANPEGFSVGLFVQPSGYEVHFAGWRQHFARLSEALHCFAFGMTSACRLRIEYRGAQPVRWRMEAQRDGDWVPDSENGPLLVPFWGERRVDVFQNRRAS
jgi:hypothetical protein